LFISVSDFSDEVPGAAGNAAIETPVGLHQSKISSSEI